MQVLPQRNFVFLFIATLVAFLGISSVVWGQTTVGPNDAGTGTNVTGVGNVSWTNTGNIASASTTDNARVTLQNNSSNYLKGSNYGFNIPPGAIINGITVDIAKLRESGAGNEIFDTSVRLVKNGSIIGSNHADPNNWTRDQGTPAVVSYGGNSDLWGATWTAADINATNFGVVIAAREPQNRNLDADVYYMRVSVTYTTTSSPSNYCTSYGNRTDGYTTGIRLVNFNTINNPTPDEDNDYSDFTAISTTLTKGLSYNLTVNVNTDGNYTNYSYAWIDWNQDGDFNDPGESFNLGTATNINNGGTSLSPLSITIPANAIIGSTRMRVSTKYYSNPNACETGFDGEVEDYTINVIPAKSITTGTISPTSYCSGTSVSIPYSITGTYNPGNIFTAQLSNATGSFAAPVNIGTLASTTAGTISGTIPVGTASGNAYRIRVVSNNPVISGTDNGNNLTVNAAPSAPALGTIIQPTCSTATGSVVLNGLPSGSWELTRSPGNIITTGTGTSTTISNLSPGTYTYTVNASNNGTGLKADYFNNMTLSGPVALARTDATVDFVWGNGNPGFPIGNDNFSVRWSGQIQPLYSENYTFKTNSDDGIRLWVNGTQIINNWTNHGPTINTNTISLTAGVKYDIVLEFYENGGGAVAQLFWSSANSQVDQIIPQSQLYPSAGGCSPSPSANVVINAQPTPPTAVLSGSATICEGGSTDLTLNITGQGPWDISGTINGNPFTTNITGSPFFLPVNPNITTTYSISSATGANGCTNNSINSSVTITVLPALQNNSISQDQTICDGFGPQTLTGTNVSGGDGTYSYLWESSTTSNSAGFNPAAGTNNTPDYDPGSLSQTSWFRRTVTSASCAGNSNVVKITLNPPIINNQLNFTNGISGTLCGTANENGVVNLSAPAETVFNYVNFASYGTPGGTCGNFTINSSCHALTSQDVSETNLLGKNTANIPATNGVYGDPCVGTVKKLNVQASYSQPICNGTAPGAISGTLPTGGDGSYTYLWESSTSGPNSGFIPATGSNTLQNYSPGVLTQTSWFKRTVTSSNCSNESPVILISVKQDNIWTGATDTDWNTASNWACNSIPSFNTNVVINGGLTNYPILNTGVLGMAKDIQINSVDSLTIIDNTLQIAGSIANSGTINSINGSVAFVGTVAQTMPATIFSANRIRNLIINNTADVSSSGNLEITGFLRVENGNFNTGNTLTLISNATQTALIDGSGNGQVVGTVKMQRHLYPEAFGYKYFSSPFSNTSVGDFSSYVDLNATFPNFYIYDENREDADSNDATGWIAYTTATNSLDILKGYALNFGDTLASPKTVEIFGTVNNGNKQITLYNNDRLYTQGFNLVGNPYPSPIDWNSATGWTKTNIDDALYFFTAGNTNMYTGTYTSYVNGIQSSDGLSSNIIPSMQGFFVHVSDGPSKVTATLGVTNSVRTNNYTQGFLKVREPEKAALIRITASFENEVNTDPAVIYFPHFAELSFEKDKDALKLMNTDIRVPNLYSLTPENKKLSINALPKPGSSEVKKIPLGLKTEKEGWMLIGLKDLENLPSNFNVYLIDSEKRIGQNLSRKPQYRFYAKSGQQDTRFHLMFSETELSDPAIAFDEPFSVRTVGGKVMVRLNLEPGESGVLLASTVTGQILDRKNVSDKEIIEIEGIKSSGVYFFSINLKDGMFSKKVLIQK